MRLLVAMTACAALGACAQTTAIPLAPGDNVTQGVRIYDKKPILMVFNKGATIEYIPNYNRGYALQFTAFLAKNDVKAQFENNSISKLDSNLDSTEIIKLLTTIASGLIGAPPPANPKPSAGEMALGPLRAMYEFQFSDEGDFAGLRRMDSGFPRPLPEAPSAPPPAGGGNPGGGAPPVTNRS